MIFCTLIDMVCEIYGDKYQHWPSKNCTYKGRQKKKKLLPNLNIIKSRHVPIYKMRVGDCLLLPCDPTVAQLWEAWSPINSLPETENSPTSASGAGLATPHDIDGHFSPPEACLEVAHRAAETALGAARLLATMPSASFSLPAFL
jgi:hypothetical protein